MIAGIGVDLTDVARIREACRKEAFRNRIYTQQELAYARERAESLAAMFAAKEAAAKALGTGFRGFEPADIEVRHNEQWQPWLQLYGGARARAEQMGVGAMHLSLTHEQGQAAAFVVFEKKEEASCSD